MARETREDRRPTILADNVRRLRHKKGWTQEKLAEQAGVSSVKMYESGARLGRTRELSKVAKALGVELADLYRPGDPENPEALDSFLSSAPEGEVSEEERDLLRAVRLPGREMTQAAYGAALVMIRMTRETQQ